MLSLSRDQFKKLGDMKQRSKTYKVLFPTPKVRVLEMTGPTKFVAKIKESALKEDGTSGPGKRTASGL